MIRRGVEVGREREGWLQGERGVIIALTFRPVQGSQAPPLQERRMKDLQIFKLDPHPEIR